MNKESLEARLQEIDKAIAQVRELVAQHTANLHALLGNRAECAHWISQCDENQETSSIPEEAP